MDNRPQGREKNITGTGKGIKKRGDGQGTGHVGGGGGIPTGGGTPSGGGKRSGGSGGLMKLAILAAALLGGGGGLMGMLGGEEAPEYAPVQTVAPTPYVQVQQQPQQSGQSMYGGLLESLLGGGFSGMGGMTGSQSPSGLTQGFDYSSMFGTGGGGSTTTSPKPSNAGWATKNNTGVLNTKVSPAAKAKRTKIKGDGKDTATVMIYMCGTDLESRSGMATKDLQEMLNAQVGDNVNLLIYTGGCSQWRNNVISSSTNQVYQVKNGNLTCLEQNAGKGGMMKAETLASFIQYCTKKFPANRNMLILWDHGGGSVTGYGYDETDKRAGAMSLSTLNTALSKARTSFDFIGYDACLMGTVETALTMAPYADYLIASEETEPGVGWYYTNWLTALSRNSSIPTTELAKQIIDDFVDVCAQKCRGQATTLALTDLAELSALVPENFNAFAASTTELLQNDGYATVSNARARSREFASSEKLDQVDLVHMALNLGTDEAKALSDAILSSVKYNRTASNMTNAYGLSIYFPYKRSSQINNAVANFDAVGLSSEYNQCIKQFAVMQSGGQSVAGTTSPMGVLGGGSSSGSNPMGSTDMLSALLGQLLGGGISMDTGRCATYLLDNAFDADNLFWQDRGEGRALYLSEDQWALVQKLELNVFVDTGDGYADLGLDNVFSFTEDGALMGSYDNSWIAIDGQEVAYYHIDSTIDEGRYTITGRVPILLNGDRAELILVFDSENPYGYIAGACFNYRDGETDTVAKLTELNEGDAIDFLCDFYTYDGAYDDTFMIGDQLIYSGNEQISNVYLTDDATATYRFTDIYDNSFWTPAIG